MTLICDDPVIFSSDVFLENIHNFSSQYRVLYWWSGYSWYMNIFINGKYSVGLQFSIFLSGGLPPAQPGISCGRAGQWAANIEMEQKITSKHKPILLSPIKAWTARFAISCASLFDRVGSFLQPR